MGLWARVQAVAGRVNAWFDPLRGTLPWRAWSRYNAVRGNVLAGGIAYFAFFSLFPAMALGFTAFAVVLGEREDLQVKLVQYVNSNLGSTVISYRSSGGGVVSVEQLTQTNVLTTAGALSLVVLVISGLGWIAALRDGVQAVFAARDGTNFIVLKLVDLLVLAAAGVAVLASVVASVSVNVATDQVVAALGIPQSGVTAWAVNVATQLLLVVVDAVIFTLLFHRLAGVDVPLYDVAAGGLVASVGFTVLKLFATVLLRAASQNRFLAAFGVVVTLLVWMNLVARVTLVGAAWAATVASDRGHLDTPDPASATAASPADDPPAEPDAVELEHVHAAPDPPAPASRRAARTLLVAGFVAGAAAVRAAGRVSDAARARRERSGDRSR